VPATGQTSTPNLSVENHGARLNPGGRTTTRMRGDTDPERRFARVVVVTLACVVVATAVVPAVAPVRAQSDPGSTSPATGDKRCFPSLVTSPSPPSALGLAARGVAVDAEIVQLRTGVMVERVPEGVSADAVWDSLVVLFDYRLSLPMFAGSIDESAYEPTDGPVSGVETRRC